MDHLSQLTKKVLIVNNGFYNARAAEACEYYGIETVNLQFGVTELPDLAKVEEALKNDSEIAVVYMVHQETGTGIKNPIREVGALAHKYNSILLLIQLQHTVFFLLISKKTTLTS